MRRTGPLAVRAGSPARAPRPLPSATHRQAHPGARRTARRRGFELGQGRGQRAARALVSRIRPARPAAAARRRWLSPLRPSPMTRTRSLRSRSERWKPGYSLRTTYHEADDTQEQGCQPKTRGDRRLQPPAQLEVMVERAHAEDSPPGRLIRRNAARSPDSVSATNTPPISGRSSCAAGRDRGAGQAAAPKSSLSRCRP